MGIGARELMADGALDTGLWMLEHVRSTDGCASYHRAMPAYDAATALIVVDVQNDFATPAGSLYVRGGEDVVPVINAEIEVALAAGARVFYTQDWHPSSTPHFEKDGGIWPVHCVADTVGAQLHSGLHVRGPVIRKGTAGEDGYSGFSMRDANGTTIATELEGLLRDGGTERVVVVGLATDYCVKETGLDARRLGYPTTLLSSAIRPVDLAAGDGERAAAELVAAGADIEADDSEGSPRTTSTAAH